MRGFKILALIALVVSLGTVNAKAMGEREKGALLGLVGGIVIYNLIDHNTVKNYNERRYETRDYSHNSNRANLRNQRRYSHNDYNPDFRNQRYNNERIIIINRVSDKTRYYDRKRDRRDHHRRR